MVADCLAGAGKSRHRKRDGHIYGIDEREAEEPRNFLTKSQAGVHTNSKEETTEVISVMPEIPCQRAVSATKGNMKIIITYPTKGDAREAELVKEVQMMMETMIMQQIKESKGDVK